MQTLHKVKEKADTVGKYSIGDIEPLIKSIIRTRKDLAEGGKPLTEEGICKYLKYNEGYISQLRSREKTTGEPQVSPKFYNQLKSLSLHYAMYDVSNKKPPSVEESATSYSSKPKIIGENMAGQKVFVEAKDLAASYERLIEEKERTIKIIQSHVEKSEKEKDRLYNFLEKQMATLLNITGQIDLNLKEAKGDLYEIENSQRAQHTVMMRSLERIEGEPGKLHKELSTLEHASQSAEEQTDSVEDVGKRSRE